MKSRSVMLLFAILLSCLSCDKSNVIPEILERISIDGTESVLTQTGVSFDKAISSDGNGSLKLEATQPTSFRLFEAGNIDAENARLIYQAKLKTENVTGQAYLEMWCVFPGLGEYFSRGLQNPLSGTINWTTAETPFFLQKGQKPNLVKLNVVIDGKGTVWIDDIMLSKGPPK